MFSDYIAIFNLWSNSTTDATEIEEGIKQELV